MRSSVSSLEAAAPAGARPLVSVVHAEPIPCREATLTQTASTTKPLTYSEMTSSTTAPLTGYTGRYTQPDPLGIVPMLSRPNFTLLSDANLFAYAMANPTRQGDRFGLLVDLGCMAGAAAEASQCFPELRRMLDAMNRSPARFIVVCGPGDTGFAKPMSGKGDLGPHIINIDSRITNDCLKKMALVHEIAEGWAGLIGYPIHNDLWPKDNDTHAWGTQEERIFCFRCCPCPKPCRTESAGDPRSRP